MKKLLVLVFACVVGCTGSGTGDDDPGRPGAPGDPGDPGDPTGPIESCVGGNNCVCPGAAECGHECSEGALECHVQGSTGPVDVVCNDNAECHVECQSAESCDVACGGSTQCHVSCPDGNCEVTNCVGDCVVSCGTDGDATLTGTTATCP